VAKYCIPFVRVTMATTIAAKILLISAWACRATIDDIDVNNMKQVSGCFM